MFLVIYALSMALAAAATLSWRWWSTTGRATAEEPDTIELAYLNGGGLLACHVAAALLRLARVVAVGPLSTVVATRRTRSGTPPLARALHRAMTEPRAWSEVLANPRVAEALGHVHQRARRQGWVLSRRQQRRTSLGALPLFAVAAFGLVRLGAGLLDHDSIGGAGAVVGLILLVTATIIIGWYLTSSPVVSRSGRRLLRHQRRTHADLSGHGIEDVTLGMALFGPAPLLTLEPEFAAELGIRRDVRYPFPRDFDTSLYPASLLTGGGGIDAR
jgi:uncharacterized protein (TIGR04222 family)